MSRATFHPPTSTFSVPGVLDPALSAPDRRARSGGPPTAVPFRSWHRTYLPRLVAGDVACALPAAAVGLALHLGPGRAVSAVGLLTAALAAAGWVLALGAARCYDRTVLGEGAEEFRHVVLSAASVLGCAAVVVWVGRYDVPAGAVAASLSLATALTLAQRYGQRRLLRRARINGRYRRTTLLVGPGPGVAALRAQLGREAGSGFTVVGCCLSGTARTGQVFAGLPVLGRPGDVVDVVRRFGVDAVAVLPSPELDGAALHRLGWELATAGTELLLAPVGTETAGRRVRTRSVCGLLLLDVGRPDVRGPRRLVKAAFDAIGAALGLVVLLPVLLGIAVAVRTTSPGPVLVRQQRVGRDGELFPILRFRTVELDGERPIARLTRLDDGTGMLVGMLQEPRVTRVGRVLRRYSLDELPQLLNVLRGEMSLVGPRPILPTEVGYVDDLRRRCAVKPGLTGLWQIDGRSGLSWEEAARLDVEYVENWSLRLDLSILWRTAGAVIRAGVAS